MRGALSRQLLRALVMSPRGFLNEEQLFPQLLISDGFGVASLQGFDLNIEGACINRQNVVTRRDTMSFHHPNQDV